MTASGGVNCNFALSFTIQNTVRIVDIFLLIGYNVSVLNISRRVSVE